MEKKIKNQHQVAVVAWSSMLLVSILPNVLLNELFNISTPWILWGKLIFLGASLILSFFLVTWKPLRHFFTILVGILLLDYGRAWLISTEVWKNLFVFNNPFIKNMFGEQTSRVISAMMMIGLLLILGYRRSSAYLQPGELGVPIGKVSWLGFKEGEFKWSRFGWMSALAIGAGTLLFLVLGGSLRFSDLQYLPGLLPMILLFAVMNAFFEEVIYRSAIIAPLSKHLGRMNLIWIPAVFFGIAHYYGVPYGVLGVVMSTFLGWLLSKSMVETKGFFWPWFIHFVQDIFIFSFIALGAIVPGG
jgi:membrane protease YdiL (CAAX protease family)